MVIRWMQYKTVDLSEYGKKLKLNQSKSFIILLPHF